jgi:septum formation protein
VRPSALSELSEGDPRHVALHNAQAKAGAALTPGVDELVLGVDTLVTLHGEIYGKPGEEDAARATLRVLSGATHEVLSGLVLLTHTTTQTAITATRVTFRELSEPLIDWYLASGEWHGRAGGYAIQGVGAALVREIEGDYENVVGLPLTSLLDLCPGLLGT